MIYLRALLLLLVAPLTFAAASPDGTQIPSATVTALTDAMGVVYTVAGGVISENGKADTTTHDVAKIVVYGGMLFQENMSAGWYERMGTTWKATTDPTPAPVAPPPAVSTNIPQITVTCPLGGNASLAQPIAAGGNTSVQIQCN